MKFFKGYLVKKCLLCSSALGSGPTQFVYGVIERWYNWRLIKYKTITKFLENDKLGNIQLNNLHALNCILTRVPLNLLAWIATTELPRAVFKYNISFV